MARGSGDRLFCPFCGHRSEDLSLRCPRCGGLALVELGSPSPDVDRSVPSIWRYSGLLPKMRNKISRGEGMTPVLRFGESLIKLESRNPTGSFADRASSIIASYLASKGGLGKVEVRYFEHFAYSLAHYLRGLAEVEIRVEDPSRIDDQEIAALASLGASVSLGPAGGGAVEYASSLTVEGLKTIAFEVFERRLGVERIVVPAETGILALSIWKGLKDLKKAGVGVEYEVVAATLEGDRGPELLRAVAPIRLVRVDVGDAVKSLVALARRGIKAKLLSAAALAASQQLGGGVALITVSQGMAPLLRRRGRRASKLKEQIIGALRDSGEATAYEIWERLNKYSLRGIYRAAGSLEREGLLCSNYKAVGGRKVKVYTLCPPLRS